MQLYWGNEQFGDHFRWTSIDHGVQLDDGSFRAVLDFDAFMVLERRTQQGSEWESDDDREYHAWTQDGWDWRLRVSEEITPGELAAIRRRLAEPRPEEQ